MTSDSCEYDFIVDLFTQTLEEERSLRIRAERNADALQEELDSCSRCLAQIKYGLVYRIEVAESQAYDFLMSKSLNISQASSAAKQLRMDFNNLLQKHRTENVKLEKEIAKTREESGRQIGSLETKIKDLEGERNELRKRVATLREELHASAMKVEELREQLKTFKADAESLSSSARQSSLDLKRAKAEAAGAATRAESFSKQLSVLREKLLEAQSQCASTQAELTVARDRRQAAEAVAAASKRRADAAVSRAELVEQEFKSKALRSENETADLEKEVSLLKRRSLALRSEAAKWKSTWKSLQQSYSALETQTNDTVEKLRVSEQSLKERLTHEKQRCRTYRDQVIHLNEELLLLRESKSCEIQRSDAMMRQAEDNLEALEKFVQYDLQAQIATLHDRNALLTANLEDFSHDNSDLRCRLDQYQQLVEEAERILVHLRGLVTSLNQKLEKTKTKHREEREQRLSEIKKLEEQLMEKILANERLQQEKGALEKSFSEEISRLTQQLGIAKRDLCQHQEGQSRQDHKFECLQKELDNALLAVCQSETAHVAEIQAKDEQLRDTELKLHSALEKIGVLETTVSTLEEKMIQERRELADKLAMTEKDQRQANQQTQAYDEAFRALQESLLVDLRAELAESRAALQVQTQETQSLCQQVEKLQLQLNDSERCAQCLRQSLSERNREVESLEAEVAQRTQLVEMRAAELDALQAAVHDRITGLQRQVRDTQQVSNDFQERLKTSEEGRELATRQLVESQNKYIELEKRVDLSENENLELKKSMEEIKSLYEEKLADSKAARMTMEARWGQEAACRAELEKVLLAKEASFQTKLDAAEGKSVRSEKKVKSLESQVSSLKLDCENLRQQAKASKRELEALCTEKHNLETRLEKSESEKRLAQQKLSVYELERAALKAVAMTSAGTASGDDTGADDDNYCGAPRAEGRPRNPRMRPPPVKLCRPGSDASRSPVDFDQPPPSQRLRDLLDCLDFNVK
nr:unnamed protein product [Spirometra erinaceieuropaei]